MSLQISFANRWPFVSTSMLIAKTFFYNSQEITKNSSTDINSSITWLPQLHDTIPMKSNYTWINYNHDNMAIRSLIMIYNSVQKLILATKFTSIYLAKGEKRLVFRPSFVNLQRAKYGTRCLMQNIDMCLLYKSHQIARLVSHFLNYFSKWMFAM